MPCPSCRRFGVPLVLLGVIGCRATAPATSVPSPPLPASRPATTRPAAGPQPFVDASVGIGFTVPAGWTMRPPAGTTRLRAAAPDESVTLTLDVPSLPAHIPGFIPVGLVASGYVDDVRKRMPDATGTPREITVPDASARRVTLSGHDAAGHAGTDDAVLMVHADRVYVLSADAGPANRSAATSALDAAVASIRWVR